MNENYSGSMSFRSRIIKSVGTYKVTKSKFNILYITSNIAILHRGNCCIRRKEKRIMFDSAFSISVMGGAFPTNGFGKLETVDWTNNWLRWTATIPPVSSPTRSFISIKLPRDRLITKSDCNVNCRKLQICKKSKLNNWFASLVQKCIPHPFKLSPAFVNPTFYKYFYSLFKPYFRQAAMV